MKSSGNAELDAVLRLHAARQAERRERWAVLHWVPRVVYHATEAEARETLARMPVGLRAGLVDCDTGDTWTGKKHYAAVKAAVRRAGKAPERFRRAGKLRAVNRSVAHRRRP